MPRLALRDGLIMSRVAQYARYIRVSEVVIDAEVAIDGVPVFFGESPGRCCGGLGKCLSRWRGKDSEPPELDTKGSARFKRFWLRVVERDMSGFVTGMAEAETQRIVERRVRIQRAAAARGKGGKCIMDDSDSDTSFALNMGFCVELRI